MANALLKRIRCTVPADAASSFDDAQRRWSALAVEPGFVAQLGGWDRRSPGDAVIVGVWRSAEDYDAFMRGPHDAIADGQRASYTAIDVRCFQTLLDMPGTAPDPRAALDRAAVLRLADCTVHADRTDHFREAQAEVWQPGMHEAGMLGGWFAVASDEPTRFVVATLWPDLDTHERYARERLPGLRERAGVAEDLATIRGGLAPLERAWTVQGR